MPINVQAPNGSMVSFPDGTDEATMHRVMSQHFGNQSAPQARTGMFDDLIPHRGGAPLAPSPSPAAQNLYHDASVVPAADGSIVRKGGRIFDFRGPDGKTYSIQGPEGATPEQAFAMLQQHLRGGNATGMMGKPPFDPSQPDEAVKPPFDPSKPFTVAGEQPKRQQSTGADQPSTGMFDDLIPKADAPGIVGGTARSFVEGIPIAGPALRNANAALSAAVAPYLDPYKPEGERLPGETFGQRYERARTQQDAEAQAFREAHPIIAPAAEIAGGVASMVPAAGTTLGARLLGLTGATLPARVGMSALSGGAISGADAAVRGDDVLSAARTGAEFGAAGPIVGRGVGKVIEGVRGLISPAASIPESSAIKSAASNAYDAVTQAANGIVMPQQTLDTLATNITNKLNGMGLRPSVAPKVHAAVSEMQKDSVDLTDLIAAKKTFKEIAGGLDKTERKAAMEAMPLIDTQVVRTAPQLYPMLKTADKNYAAAMTAQMIENATKKGVSKAERSGVGGNVDNAIRQRIGSIVDSEKKAAGLQPAELAQAERVVSGGPAYSATNVARQIGRLDPSSGGLAMMLHLGATLPTAGMNLPVAAAGFAARKIAEARTKAAANQLAEMIRSRAPASQGAVNARIIAEAARQARLMGMERAGNSLTRAAGPRVFGSFSPEPVSQ